MDIPFNKPYFTGLESEYIKDTINSGKTSGNGIFTKKCLKFFKHTFGFNSLLTSSCTDALEMSAILSNILPGDEVIVPSYTFVSTANAFVLRGAKIRFADSRKDHPGIDEESIELLITERTKAIVIVHYAGVACDMRKILSIANRYNLILIEDAAQAIDSYYQTEEGNKPLGSFGDYAAFSFHETKNIISGEGGLLVVKAKKDFERAEIIWEKGTNRAQFFRGEVDKYNWVDIGSSFLSSDITAAYLYAQLENLEKIQQKRIAIWQEYYQRLLPLMNQGCVKLPVIPDYATNNAHMFYLVLDSLERRDKFIAYLKSLGILSVFHYISLHKSKYHLSTLENESERQNLPMADFYSDCLVRLPLFYELTSNELNHIIDSILSFYKSES